MKRMLVMLTVAAIVLSAGMIAWCDETPRPQPPMVPQGPGPGGPGQLMNPGQGPGGMPQVPPNAMFMPEPLCPGVALAHTMMPLLVMDPALRMSREQINKLQMVLATNEQTLAPLREKAGKAMDELRNAMLADDYDAKKVQELAAASEKAATALDNAELDQWKQIRAILTIEQVKYLRESGNRMPMFGMPGMVGPGPGGPPQGGQMMPGPMGPRPGGQPNINAR